MIGLIGEPARRKRLAKSSGSAPLECLFEAGTALLECLPEAAELVPVVCVALLCVFALCLVGAVVYHLTFDPNAVDVASRLDMLSINPEKWFPRS
jgi:hypothetical protein